MSVGKNGVGLFLLRLSHCTVFFLVPVCEHIGVFLVCVCVGISGVHV